MTIKYMNKCLLLVGLIFGSIGAWSQITTFDYTGVVDSYTVPVGVTSISIQAYGAQGGNGNGGLGAGIYGEFAVTPGDILSIAVGEQGVVNNCGGPDASGGGGGGSFVWDPLDAALPMIAAGAGGGGNENWGGLVCRNGVPGQAAENGTSGSEGLAAGGTGGNGGAGDAPSGTGSGGGGWLTAGQNSTWGDGCTGGTTVPTFAGGNGASGFAPGGEGGFGGGGGAVCGCGGGGGYSGGAGGNGSSCRAGGGGGGSYNGGLSQVNETGVQTGNGQIIITVLCSAIDVEVTDEEICLGQSFTLDGTGAGVITWDGGVENGEPFTPDEAGVFTYTATSDDDGDCGFTIDIEVLELPEVTASVDVDEICIGESIVLTGSGADDYEWFPLEIEDGEDYTPEVGEYTYTVIGTDDETGCENTAEVEVTVYDLPEVLATATDDEICLGESVTLNGEGAATYDWDPEEEDGVEFTPDATGTTTYTVVGTDDNGCINEADIDVTVYEALEITYTTTDEIFGSDGTIDITVTGGSTPYTYDWDNDGTGDFDDVEDLDGLTCGTYIVVVMCDAGCTATETIEVACQVSIDELNGLAVSIYPNPAYELVTISLEGTFTYTLTTVNGDVVLNGNGFNSEEISLDELAKGIYMINVFAGDQSTVIKLVKE